VTGVPCALPILLDNDVDVTAMMEEIRSQEENWYVETGRQKSIPVQSETESIPLVKPIPLLGVTGHPSQWDSHRYTPTPLYEKYPHIISWLIDFSRKTGEKIARVALVRLKVDGQVGSHIDFGEYYRHRNRYHLCLDGAYYYHVNNESKLIEAGTLFRFDNDMPHWAVNEGNIPRISVIFDTES
jgi:mannose-6-phosphate isomerase-like protein (cupin superfamily)